MKTFKMLLVACSLSMSLFVDAAPSQDRFGDTHAIYHEVEQILHEAKYILKDDLQVKIFFSVSEEQTIQCVNVASGNEDLDYFLKQELENRLLTGSTWREGMIYEISVDYSDTLLAYSHL